MLGRPLAILSILPPPPTSPVDPAGELCEALRLRGHAITAVVAAHGRPDPNAARASLESIAIGSTSERQPDAFATLLARRQWDIVFDQWNHPTSLAWVEAARRAGAKSVHRVSDAALCCDRRTLRQADALPCPGGPETVEKCLGCIAPDWRDRGGAAAARVAAALATRRVRARAAFDRADQIVFETETLATRHAEVGFATERARTIRRGAKPFALAPDPSRGLGGLRVGLLGPLAGTPERLDAWIDAASQLRVLNVAIDIGIFDRPECASASLKPLEQLAASAPDIEVCDVLDTHDLARVLGRIDGLVEVAPNAESPLLQAEATFAGVPTIDLVDLVAIARTRRAIDDAPLSEIRLLVEQASEVEALFWELLDERSGVAPTPSLSARRGRALLRRGRPVEATPFFEAAGREAGERADLLLGLGVASFARGDRRRSFEQLSRAHALAPLEPDIVVSLAAAAGPEQLPALGPTIRRAEAAHPDDPHLRRLTEALGRER